MKSKLILIAALLFLINSFSFAQEVKDTLLTIEEQHQLENVVIVGKMDLTNTQSKVLSSLDAYLESNNAVNMIKRGAYAWEPVLNGMSTERSLVTIDGMRIYGACTDKMDPITSYVEITNLSKANIQSGQAGSCHGATIAGSIDLIRQHSNFDNSGFKVSVFTGLESNNWQKILGTKLQYASNKFYTDIDFTYRDAQNYKAGGNQEILYSQFTKYNLSALAGWKINQHQDLTASLIYDKASNVGYPALPMDVSLARAYIGSLQYNYRNLSASIYNWETKIYYNQVTHIMDDTHRPDVPIRMDMPGWTNTSGFYSKMQGSNQKHIWQANVNGHFNKSLAEMTMFSNTEGEKDMFMLTWPGVHTYFGGIFVEDQILWNTYWSSTFTAGAGIHYNLIKDTFGFESLKIFYPDMTESKLRWLKNLGVNIKYAKNSWIAQAGAGYAERAPSVSEGYGFYLFNSFDRYDYVGNPNMKNEKSLEFNASASYASDKWYVKLQANYFRIFDYIIGKPQAHLSAMTIGANGIKVYEQLPYASLFNINTTATYHIISGLDINAKAIYRLGWADTLNLPQIQPFSYGLNVKYTKKSFNAEIGMDGALQQTKFSKSFGETPAPAYVLFSISGSKQFQFSKHTLITKVGIENIFDKNYSTFADWNRIPRMGRNFYLNVIYKFK